MHLLQRILPRQARGSFGTLSGVGVELLVFLGRKPSTVRDLAGRLVWCREIEQMADSAVTQGGFHDLSRVTVL